MALAATSRIVLSQGRRRRLQRLGLPAEPRKFNPHVTLARISGMSARSVADYLAARGLFRSRGFEVEDFVLFSARALTGGGPYVVEADYPLELQPARAAMAGR
jgi:RNA 2',3'-cyclic 3'-phosphodiesterase